MKLANRIGAAVLATAMVGTLLTGCGGGSASTTASTGDGTAAASSTESSGDGDNTYTMFMRSTYVDWMYASMKHGFAALRFARALRIIPKCPATVDNLHDCPAVFAAGHFW